MFERSRNNTPNWFSRNACNQKSKHALYIYQDLMNVPIKTIELHLLDACSIPTNGCFGIHVVCINCHEDIIKWKYFPRYWPFVRGIHRSPVNSPHKGQWRRALLFSLICARISGWVNSREAGDLICHRAHYDVIVMFWIRAKC